MSEKATTSVARYEPPFWHTIVRGLQLAVAVSILGLTAAQLDVAFGSDAEGRLGFTIFGVSFFV